MNDVVNLRDRRVKQLEKANISLTNENEEMRAALRDIAGVLGPTIPNCNLNKCEGCRADMQTALNTARETLELLDNGEQVECVVVPLAFLKVNHVDPQN